MKRQPKRIDTVQLPRPPLPLSLCFCLSSTLPSLWQRWKERENKRQARLNQVWGWGRLFVWWFFIWKERKTSVKCKLLWGFNTALSPVVCVLVSSECYVFDMRVNNGPAGKRSVCVFTALHALRCGVSCSPPPLLSLSRSLSLTSVSALKSRGSASD